jgi:hypothetical protein
MLEIIRDIEKRRYKRIDKTFMARFRPLEQGQSNKPGTWDIVTLHNLSAGGTFFTYNDEIKRGDSLGFLIPFPGSKELIDCVGEAIRVEKKELLWRIGVSFTQIDGEKKDIINNSVDTVHSKTLLKMPPTPKRDTSWSRYRM